MIFEIEDSLCYMGFSSYDCGKLNGYGGRYVHNSGKGCGDGLGDGGCNKYGNGYSKDYLKIINLRIQEWKFHKPL
jgi:hypothetical protein